MGRGCQGDYRLEDGGDGNGSGADRLLSRTDRTLQGTKVDRVRPIFATQRIRQALEARAARAVLGGSRAASELKGSLRGRRADVCSYEVDIVNSPMSCRIALSSASH